MYLYFVMVNFLQVFIVLFSQTSKKTQLLHYNHYLSVSLDNLFCQFLYYRSARVITSGCSTAAESFIDIVEKNIAENFPSRIKDKNDMLNIIDNLNNNCIPKNTFSISFDVVNVFPVFINNLE